MADSSIVLPGERLGEEEEFESGAYAFVDENGTIRASVMGTPAVDQRVHRADVLPKRIVKPLDVGSVAVGRVVIIKNSAAVIEMLRAENNGEPRVISMSYASLPVHKIARQYVRTIRETLRIGDIVRARVTFVAPFGIDLATEEPGMGVIRAHCRKCRSILHAFGARLKCTNCGSDEVRKIPFTRREESE